MMREKNQVEGDRKLRQSVRIDRQKVLYLSLRLSLTSQSIIQPPLISSQSPLRYSTGISLLQLACRISSHLLRLTDR